MQPLIHADTLDFLKYGYLSFLITVSLNVKQNSNHDDNQFRIKMTLYKDWHPTDN